MPRQFVPLIELYKKSWKEYQKEKPLQLWNQYARVCRRRFKAGRDEFFPAYISVMSRIGKERGWQPMSRDQFEAMRSPMVR
jgi:hypothetical protein